MNVVITITLPRNAQSLTIASDLVRRFGDDQASVTIEAEPIDEADDEADDDDVDPEMVLTILQGASRRMGDTPEARQLAELVHALQAPPAQRREELIHPSDAAPPHGIPRPETTFYAKPNPTQKRRGGNTLQRHEALDLLVMNTSCPTCHAARGSFCHSTKPGRSSSESYGYQHVHQARINLMPWAP
jgi:hypothetical protein